MDLLYDQRIQAIHAENDMQESVRVCFLQMKFAECFKKVSPTYMQVSGQCDIAHVNGSGAITMRSINRNLDDLCENDKV